MILQHSIKPHLQDALCILKGEQNDRVSDVGLIRCFMIRKKGKFVMRICHSFKKMWPRVVPIQGIDSES